MRPQRPPARADGCASGRVAGVARLVRRPLRRASSGRIETTSRSRRSCRAVLAEPRYSRSELPGRAGRPRRCPLAHAGTASTYASAAAARLSRSASRDGPSCRRPPGAPWTHACRGSRRLLRAWRRRRLLDARTTSGCGLVEEDVPSGLFGLPQQRAGRLLEDAAPAGGLLALLGELARPPCARGWPRSRSRAWRRPP